MGNCFPVTINLDNVCITCYDRNKGEIMYITEFKTNLQALKTSTADLLAVKNDLLRRVQQEELEGPKRLQVVDNWLNSAQQKLSEADELTTSGDNEIASRGGCCCCKNTVFSYSIGKSFVDMKAQLDSIKQNRQQFNVLVDAVWKEPKYVTRLKRDIKDLKAAKIELEATNNDVMRKISSQEVGKMKRLDRVRAWMSQVEQVLTVAGKLLRVCSEEAQDTWRAENFPDQELAARVSGTLEDVRKLITQGDFEVVVERVDSEYLSKLQDNVKRLSVETRSLSALKDDVTQWVRSDEDTHQRKELKQVKAWRKITQARITEADNMLRVAPQEIQKLEAGESFTDFGEKVEKMLKDVVDQKNHGQFPQVTAPALPDPVIEMECGLTVGLQTKIDEVWTELMKPDLGTLGLYGLGGVGKTTLMTHINNKFMGTLNDFDFVIWIVVSKDFSLTKIQEEIGERIGIAVNDWKRKNAYDKAKDIKSLLQRKKFVLLLDDVWEKLHLDKVGVPIPKKTNGAKIVFTSRSELVCSLMGAPKSRMKVDILPPEQAWELFEENLGKDTLSADQTIRGLAELVAEECKGLPLALIVVARAMACCKDAEEWRSALIDLQQSASDLDGIKDEVFVRLKLSYDRLPDDKHRSCFIYCALFPEDFKICKDDLIDYWISEKFEDDENGECISRAKALNILRRLISVCLLEEEGKHVKLHDMIRDMALWISCEFEKEKYNFLVQAGKQLSKAPDMEKWKGVKRTSLMENSIQDLPEIPCCPDLKTLLLCGNPRLQKINGNIFHFSPCLTVLNLSNTRIQVLPPGVTDLPLQYLNLSRTWIEELPRDLKKLEKLIYLNLEHNDLLGMIPKGVISTFLSLQVLRIFRSGFFFEGAEDNILPDSKVLIEEIQQLKHLDVVSITITSIDALRLYFNTKKVQSCTRDLSLEGLGRSKAIQFSPTETMEKLETLQISASEHLEQINVRSLISCFGSLRKVVVEYCPRMLNLYWLAGAPNLALLKVVVCVKIVEIINDAGENQMAFSKLEELELEGLPKLEKICGEGLFLPSIKRMRVLDCPMLKKVPLNPEILKVRKIIIEAEEHWWKDVEFDDQATKETFLPSFRSYPPRSKIHMAPHHYYDIWRPKSS